MVAHALIGAWETVLQGITIEQQETKDLSFDVQCETNTVVRVDCQFSNFKVDGVEINLNGNPFDELYVSANGIDLTMQNPDGGEEFLKGSYQAEGNTIKWNSYENDKIQIKEMKWTKSGEVYIICVCSKLKCY